MTGKVIKKWGWSQRNILRLLQMFKLKQPQSVNKGNWHQTSCSKYNLSFSLLFVLE